MSICELSCTNWLGMSAARTTCWIIWTQPCSLYMVSVMAYLYCKRETDKPPQRIKSTSEGRWFGPRSTICKWCFHASTQHILTWIQRMEFGYATKIRLAARQPFYTWIGQKLQVVVLPSSRFLQRTSPQVIGTNLDVISCTLVIETSGSIHRNKSFVK